MTTGGTGLGLFSTVIFDLDGVLVNTSPCHARAYDDLWRKLGISGPPYAELAGRTTRESVTKVAASLEPTPAQIDEWVKLKQELARKYMNSESIEFPDTRPVVDRLVMLGYSLGVGTSASRDSATAMLGRAGLDGAFAIIVTGDDVARGKPAPDIYERTMESLDANPERTLIVEDSASGLEAALESGARAAIVHGKIDKLHQRFLGSYENLMSLMVSMGVRLN